MSLKAEMTLKSALLSTGLVQPVDSKVRKGRVEVLCRQVPGQEKSWLNVVEKILTASEEASQDVHLCRRYVLRDGQMLFGWHIQVDAEKVKDLMAAVEVVVQVLASAKPSLDVAPKEPPRPPTVPRQNVQQPRRPLAPGQHPPKAPAHPRAPSGGPGTAHEAPAGFSFEKRTVLKKREENGMEMIVEEMPLPHIHSELNVPSRPRIDPKTGKSVGGGRGASYTGAS